MKDLPEFSRMIEDLLTSLNLTPGEWKQIFLSSGQIDLWIKEILHPVLLEEERGHFRRAWLKSKLWTEYPDTLSFLTKEVFLKTDGAREILHEFFKNSSIKDWEAFIEKADSQILSDLKNTIFQFYLDKENHQRVAGSDLWIAFPDVAIALVKDYIAKIKINSAYRSQLISFENVKWQQHPDFVIQFIRGNWNIFEYPEMETFISNKVLLEFPWSKYPEFFLEFCRKAPSNNVPWLLTQIDLSNTTAEYSSAIKEALVGLPELAAGLFNRILNQVQANPSNFGLLADLLTHLVNVTNQDSLVAARFFTLPGSETQVELLFELIKRGRADWTINRHVLNQPIWREKLKAYGFD